MIGSLFAFCGWALAAFFAALYLGERGRRKDIAWLAGLSSERRAATIRVAPDAESEIAELISKENKERLIQDLMRTTGCSRKTAEEEAQRLLDEAARIGAEGW